MKSRQGNHQSNVTIIGMLCLVLGVALSHTAQAAGNKPKPTPSTSLKVMDYNVQNFFDTVDSPDTDDAEFTPNGAQKWTDQVLADKINNLSQVIRSANPDVIGLEEVENQDVINMLMANLKGAGYVFGYAGPSQDARGIRCAVLSKLPVLSTVSHQVWKDSWKKPDGSIQKTRDVLEVNIDVSSRTNGVKTAVTLLVNHWPSRAGGPERDHMRVEVAEQEATIIQNILNANPNRLIISVGDFNDELSNNSFKTGINMVRSLTELNAAPIGSAYALDSELESLPDAQKGTFWFARDKVWNTLDHILVAKGADLLAGKASGFDYRPNSIQVLHPTQFLDNQGHPAGCELRDAGRDGDATRCLKGVSDHLPLMAIFDYTAR